MGQPYQNTAEIGSRVGWWLRTAYPGARAKRVAQQFGVSETTAKRWLGGVPPTTEHLQAMAKAWGWRFVQFIYSPVCAGPDYDARLASDIDELKERLARLEAQGNEGNQAAVESRSDAPGTGADQDGRETVEAPRRAAEAAGAVARKIGGAR